MQFYTVRASGKRHFYLDEQGDGSFEPVAMAETKAIEVASNMGALVQVWNATLRTEYSLPQPELPRLEVR